MKLISFLGKHGPQLAALDADNAKDLSALAVPDVGALLNGPGLDAALEACKDAPDLGPWSQLKLLCPVHKPQRIICVGANYDLHRQEMGRQVLEHPTLFVRWPSSLVAHGEQVVRPKASERFDYEGELALIIGRQARSLRAEDAMPHVAGYTCFNDGSVRDFQRHTTQFTPGKNFDASGAMGPCFVSADEIHDPHNLELRTRLNGQPLQSANTGQMSFRIPELLAYISTFTTLQPGDVVATGTPSGVGDKRKPPVYLKPGDRLEVEISQVGRLEVGVRQQL